MILSLLQKREALNVTLHLVFQNSCHNFIVLKYWFYYFILACLIWMQSNYSNYLRKLKEVIVFQMRILREQLDLLFKNLYKQYLVYVLLNYLDFCLIFSFHCYLFCALLFFQYFVKQFYNQLLWKKLKVLNQIFFKDHLNQDLFYFKRLFL